MEVVSTPEWYLNRFYTPDSIKSDYGNYSTVTHPICPPSYGNCSPVFLNSLMEKYEDRYPGIDEYSYSYVEYAPLDREEHLLPFGGFYVENRYKSGVMDTVSHFHVFGESTIYKPDILCIEIHLTS